ncbi:hypothetical protein D3C87_887610 [compost metagenome]
MARQIPGDGLNRYRLRCAYLGRNRDRGLRGFPFFLVAESHGQRRRDKVAALGNLIKRIIGFQRGKGSIGGRIAIIDGRKLLCCAAYAGSRVHHRGRHRQTYAREKLLMQAFVVGLVLRGKQIDVALRKDGDIAVCR